MVTNANQLAKSGKFGDLRRRLTFLLLALVVYRVGAHIPAWKTPVYYDQEGTLVRKLGITGVPAIVSQEGSRLRIDEVTVR